MFREMLAIDPTRRNNGQLIADVARLGYINELTDRVLDVTYGQGGFWTDCQPVHLTASDIALNGVDFRHLPWSDGTFDVVVFDPPYRLRGTPALGDADKRYGTTEAATVQEVLTLIREGAIECARVTREDGYLLVKCQDQVASGRVHWQTDLVRVSVGAACTLVDRLELLSHRPQPPGRTQVHARRNHSTLLIFRKDRS